MYKFLFLPKSLLGMAVSAALLSACGGEGNSDANPSSQANARLTAPVIANLAYQGSTGTTGRTDVTGAYLCKTGETVSFSLGGVMLGSVICSQDAEASLMQLAGGDLTMETTLDEMQRASGTWEVLPYDRWINRLALLGALDSNADLEDGVQLPDGLDNLMFLQTGKVRFDQDQTLFRTQIEQISKQAAQANLYQRPLSQFSQAVQGALIKELGVGTASVTQFPGYMVTSTVEGSEQITVTYDELGRLTKFTFVEGGSTSTQSHEFDAQGRLTKIVMGFADGKEEMVRTYGGQNRVTKNVETTYASDGVKLAETVTDRFYDADGFLRQVDQGTVDTTSQTRMNSQTSYRYNAFGLLESSTTVASVEVNGVRDNNRQITKEVDNTYNANGDLEKTVREQKDGQGVEFARTMVEYAYDADGRVTQRNYRREDGQGRVLSSNQATYNYTDDGYPVSVTRIYTANGQETGRYRDMYQYGKGLTDFSRRLTKKVRTHFHPDYGNGEQPVRTFLLTYTYNDMGLRTRVEEKITEYQDGEGNAQSIPLVSLKLQEWEYDDNHNPLSIKTDSDGDGTFESIKTMAWQRLPRLGYGAINFKASTFTSYDKNYQINSASEDGWEVALMPTPPVQGTSDIGLLIGLEAQGSDRIDSLDCRENDLLGADPICE